MATVACPHCTAATLRLARVRKVCAHTRDNHSTLLPSLLILRPRSVSSSPPAIRPFVSHCVAFALLVHAVAFASLVHLNCGGRGKQEREGGM